VQDDGEYRGAGGFVNVGDKWCLELDAIWRGVDAAEASGIALGQIGRALTHNWTAAVVALALHNTATLRVLIAEASP
jgi:hypothetical protein